ncbi:hypothetical protein LZ575_20570 [Antarcticibacterium sp. 1MA-6-2]|uniref:hypothetical protein n=1 Tax=Antarcticibacterium sp. 1MA-6-2 TaxID=2908210 RepID=UPI001F28950A|nr:hypothetical protein [Antarcticibacterium sp. 1MA-6-2]UJH91033.1 hypothetical protein LZ575_20570 [Antarcticibacterium sp. 1MA-6-2]
MKSIKKLARLLTLLLLIMLASVLPVPIPHYYKDITPKFSVEQVDKKKEETQEEEILKVS